MNPADLGGRNPGWPGVWCEAWGYQPSGEAAVKWAAPLFLGEPGSRRGVSGEALTKESERELVQLNVDFRHLFMMIDTSS